MEKYVRGIMMDEKRLETRSVLVPIKIVTKAQKTYLFYYYVFISFASGRTEAYNFDEWTRAHYSSTFSRQQIAKEKANQIREMDAYFKVKEQDGGVAPYFFFFLLSIVMAYNYMFTTNYDNPMLVEQKKERRNSMSGEVKSER